MCRNIKTLFNFEPPASDDEIHAAALQFVRKVTGSVKPSKKNEQVFEAAVDQVSETVRELLDSMHTQAPAINRETEAAKVRARNLQRFAQERIGSTQRT